SGKLATCLVPPPVFTTTFTTVSLGCRNVFVIVHVFESPAASDTLPLVAQSPVIAATYAASPVSLTVCPPVVLLFVTPEVTPVVSMNSGKLATCLVPPPVFTTTFVTVNFGCRNVFVIVHVLESPAASVTLPLVAQSPVIAATYAASPVSLTVCPPAALSFVT